MEYVVTGIGMYNGLGKNVKDSWENLKAGKSPMQKIVWPQEDDPNRYPSTYKSLRVQVGALSPPPEDVYPDYFEYGWPMWDPNTRTCLLTVDEALKDSELKSKNVGVCVSTFGSGTVLRLELFAALNSGARKVSPRKTLNIGLDFPAAQISAIYKVTGPNTALDSACTTGLTSIGTAINMMKADPDLDAVIVGGSDRMVEPIYMFWFQNLNALNLTDDLGASKPFDKNRSGFVTGEGAATMIIEPMDKAIKRGAKIYGIVKSTSFITLFDSDTSPDPEGNGAKMCVQQALDRAGITANDVGYVNAHATSTPVGDQIEFDAMLKLTPNRIMVSNKGQIGHCMSAAGLFESIYTLLALKEQVTPPNTNLTEPLGEGMILPTVAMDIDAKYAVKNSFGFGGRNASIVLERYDS